MRWDLTEIFDCPDCDGNGIDDSKIKEVINDCDDDNDNKLSVMRVDEQRQWIVDNIGSREIQCDRCEGEGIVVIELSEDGYNYIKRNY